MQLITKYLQKNILYKNSLFLIASNGFLAIMGFLFWILAARIYSTYDIGIATSVLSLSNLLSTIALLGFNASILRFLPVSTHKDDDVNSTILLTSLISGLLAIIVILFIRNFSPTLQFLRTNYLYFAIFILCTVFAGLNQMVESILTAFRSSKHVFFKNILFGSVKLIPLYLLVFLSGFGLFSSYYIGLIISVLYALLIITKKNAITYQLKLSTKAIKKMAYLSFGLYISGFATVAPSFVLPLLITNILGPRHTAYYYIAATTNNVLNLIPQVIAQNLLVEGAYKESKLKIYVIKAFQLIALIIIPAITIMFLFGNHILLVFGRQYSHEGFELLKLLSLSVILVGVNSVLNIILTIKHRIKFIIITSIFCTLLNIGISYYLLHLGLRAIGYATIISQLLLFILYIFNI